MERQSEMYVHVSELGAGIDMYMRIYIVHVHVHVYTRTCMSSQVYDLLPLDNLQLCTQCMQEQSSLYCTFFTAIQCAILHVRHNVPLTKCTVYTKSHMYMYMSSGTIISHMYVMVSGYKVQSSQPCPQAPLRTRAIIASDDLTLRGFKGHHSQ